MTLKKLEADPSKHSTYRHNLQIYSKTSSTQGDVQDELIHLLQP